MRKQGRFRDFFPPSTVAGNLSWPHGLDDKVTRNPGQGPWTIGVRWPFRLLIPILVYGETDHLLVALESGEWSNLLLEWILPSGKFSLELLLRIAVFMEYLAEFFVT